MEIVVLAMPLVIWSPTDVVNVLHGCQNLNESYKRTGIRDQQVRLICQCVCYEAETGEGRCAEAQ